MGASSSRATDTGRSYQAPPSYSMGSGHTSVDATTVISPGPVYDTRHSPGTGDATKAGLPTYKWVHFIRCPYVGLSSMIVASLESARVAAPTLLTVHPARRNCQVWYLKVSHRLLRRRQNTGTGRIRCSGHRHLKTHRATIHNVRRRAWVLARHADICVSVGHACTRGCRYESYPWRMKKGKKKPAKQPGPAANLVHESLVKTGTVHGGPNSSVKFGMDGRCAHSE